MHGRFFGLVLVAAALFLVLPADLFSQNYTTVEGKFKVQGRQDKRGEYTGTLHISKVSGDRYSASGSVQFADGETRAIDGVGYYNGSWWWKRFVIEYTIDGAGVTGRLNDVATGNSSADAIRIQGRYRVSSDKTKIYGSWKSISGAKLTGYDTLHRVRDEIKITAVEPAAGQQGDSAKRLVILGENLPGEGNVQATDVAFLRDGAVDAGIKITRIFEYSDDGSRLEVEANLAKDAAPGLRDVRVLQGLGRGLFTVQAADVRLPLGRSAKVTGGQWAKVLVPDVEGGELTLHASGASFEVRRGSREGAVLNPVSGTRYTIARGGHGWLFVKVNGTGELTVSNTFVQTAETPAEKKPWNFWYFPFFDRPTNGQNLYDDGGAYEKLDRVLGIQPDANAKFVEKNHMDKEFKLPTDAMELARYNPSTIKGWAYCYQRSTDDKKSWWGHCWGAVVASSLWAQPKGRTVKDPAGKDAAFSEEEVEGLLTAYYTNHGCYPTNYMRDCPPGRPKEDLKEPVDRHADDFFLGLQKGILRDGLPLACNLRAQLTDEKEGTQVWNHVIWKYEARFQEVEGKDDPTYVEVALKVTATDDVYPSGPSAHRDEDYVLRFKYGTDGQIRRDEADFQNWVSAKHFAPSYLWRIKSATPDGTENEVLGEHLDDLKRLFEYEPIR